MIFPKWNAAACIEMEATLEVEDRQTWQQDLEGLLGYGRWTRTPNRSRRD